MTDDRPLPPDPLASCMSAVTAVAVHLTLRGQPDDLAAARLLHQQLAVLRDVWWRVPPISDRDE